MYSRLGLLGILLLTVGVATYQFDNEIKPDLLQDLTDIFNLIPKITVDELVSKHMLIDPKCRKAFVFLKSHQFKELLQQALNLREVAEILTFLHALKDTSNNYNTILKSNDVSEQVYKLQYMILSVPNQPYKVDLEFESITAAAEISAESQTHNLNDFISFINELLQHLPREEFVQLVNNKRAKSVDFDLFYKAARNPDFRTKVEAALKSPDVVTMLQPLNDHNIDVKSLVPVLFQVLSWGPPAVENPKTIKLTYF